MRIILTMLLTLLLVLNPVSAIMVTAGEFEINGEFGQGITETEIMNGESIRFDAVFSSDAYPITYSVSLRNDEGEIIHSYADGVEHDQENMIYRQIYTIESEYYGNPGDYNIIINGVDNEGSASFRILLLTVNQVPENQAPRVTDITGYNQINEGIINFGAIAIDPDEGDQVERVEFQIFETGNVHQPFTDNNGNDGWNYEFDSSEIEFDDNVRIRARAFDGELWSNFYVEGPFTIDNRIPNQAPTIRLVSPEDGTLIDELNILLEWQGEDNENDVLTYTLYLNNNVILRAVEDTQYQLQNLEYNTVYTWRVVVYDGINGPVGSETWTFITLEEVIENQAPIVNIVNPNERETIEGIYNIEWDANDIDGDVINTKLYYKRINDIPLIGFILNFFNGYELLVDLQGNPENYNWDTTNFRNGAYSLGIVVTDDDNAQGEDIVERIAIMNIIEEENNAPRIISEPITKVKVNTKYIYDVNALDVDGDNIIYNLISAPKGMQINQDTGVISWLPEEVSQYGVIVRATDEHGLHDSQIFTIKVLPKEVIIPKEPREVHKFSISNVILDQNEEYIKVYIQVKNKGNQDELIELKVFNMNTGDMVVDSFNLEDNDNYWRILNLPKPKVSGTYTIGVWGNSEDYKDMLYREIII
tara:strand:- start:1665 stop:3602 length:1938 start_codon:yes stop_codon:yes gene_type:complete